MQALFGDPSRFLAFTFEADHRPVIVAPLVTAPFQLGRWDRTIKSHTTRRGGSRLWPDGRDRPAFPFPNQGTRFFRRLIQTPGWGSPACVRKFAGHWFRRQQQPFSELMLMSNRSDRLSARGKEETAGANICRPKRGGTALRGGFAKGKFTRTRRLLDKRHKVWPDPAPGIELAVHRDSGPSGRGHFKARGLSDLLPPSAEAAT